MSALEIIIIVVVVVGIIIALFGWDRYRGKGKDPSPGGTARPTDELFIDPETGARTRVWYDTKTGQREYRPERES
jgi:hypothetical protein